MDNNQLLAKVAINKSLLKEYSNSEYSRIVYMRNNSEFQIQIFNPYSYTIGAVISIDNKRLGNTLIIKPGERVWLERYFDVAKKFLFSIYEVSGNNQQVKEAIQKNGEITIEFYKEQERPNLYLNKGITYNPVWYNCDYTTTCGCDNINSVQTLGFSGLSSDITTAKLNCDSEIKCYNSSLSSENTRSMSKSLTTPLTKKTIETGRVEKGSNSNQQFYTMDIDFEYFSFKKEIIKILPESQKPIYKSDLQKQYCSNCGRKLNQKYKYCPYCGAKVDFCPNNNQNKNYILEKCPNCSRTVRSNMMECPHCGEILR